MTAQTHSALPDPTLPVVERQLAMLAEVAQIAMVLSRAYGAAAIAAAHAVEVILADEFWQPETGRARALAGSKDAAEGFRKVSRSLRLTLTLEMKTAETLRDLRAGVITNSNTGRQGAAETPAFRLNPSDKISPWERPRPARSCSVDAAPDFERGCDTERLFDIERPDRFVPGTFRAVVDGLCADIGVTPDWSDWKIVSPKTDETLQSRPSGHAEIRPSGPPPRGDVPDDRDRSEHPPPR